MINSKLLRSKVLDLAMRGQLSERIASDSSSDELYKEIIELKQELVKNKVIRKDSVLDDVQEGDYDIPTEWKWVRFGKIITLQSGQDLKSAEYNNQCSGIPYITGASNFNDDGTLIINRWTEMPKNIAKYGDVLVSVKGTVGKISVLSEKEVHIARQIMAIRTYKMDIDFVKYFVESSIDKIKDASKGMIPGIERNDILNLCCPLPPIEEQKRIAEKLSQAFRVLDNIDNLKELYLSDIEILKSKIIDVGLQGKLTEQLPEDGNAKDLLNQIRNKKDWMINEGIIPKESTSKKINDEDRIFDIPQNWACARVQDVATYITDYVANGSFATLKANTTTYKEPNYAVFVRTIDLGAKFQNELSYIDKTSYEFLKKSKLYGGELILPNIGASIGKAFIMPDLGMPMSLAPNSIMVKFENDIMNKYFYYVFQSSYGRGILMNIRGGAATPKFSKTDLRKMIVMLPPLEEQKRIVKKIEDMLALI